MLKLPFASVAIIVVIAGCSSTGNIQRFTTQESLVVLENNPQLYAHEDDSFGDPLRRSDWKEGDRVPGFAKIPRGGGVKAEWYYLTIDKGDSVWVQFKQVTTELGATAKKLAWVEIPTSESDAAWARAKQWIEEHRDRAMDVVSDTLISTDKPISSGSYGYTVRRETLSNGKTRITMDADYKAIGVLDPSFDLSLKKEKAAHLFIATGKTIEITEVP